MAELRALVVDDEPLARRGIRQLLASHPDITVAAEVGDGHAALHALATGVFDLVFLDIQMPGLDGLGVVRQHGVKRMPEVIFVTAHDHFAVRAFEAEALDYLVKPISAERFDAAIQRVRERLGIAPASPRGAERIPVSTAEGQLLLDPAEIDWIEADDYHATVHTRLKPFRIRASLAQLETHLDPARFLRIHRAAIVALDRVRELVAGDESGDATVVLRNGTRVPVSRRRLADLRRRMRLPSRRT